MSSYKYKVYRVGVHARDLLEPERLELEKVGAEQIVLPRIEGDELIEQAGDADGIIDVDSPITRRDMEAMRDLKVVLRTGVGVDVIDVEAATDLGVAVVCVPDLWIREVANHAFALLLACNRRLLKLDSIIRSGGWVPVIPPPVGSIHNETLGIVGFGRIGRALATRAQAFEMKVIAHDPYLPPEAFEEAGVEPASFDELLARSDYISVHSPKTDETTHMFSDAAFAKMKSDGVPDQHFAGPGRGPGRPGAGAGGRRDRRSGPGRAGAGAPAGDDPLLGMDNVVLTPHSSYYSDAAIADLPVRCGQEVARVLTGRRPLNLFNPKVLEKLPLAD